MDNLRALVVTDNTVEKIEIKECGEGFALIKQNRTSKSRHITILNLREAKEIATFIKERKEDNEKET